MDPYRDDRPSLVAENERLRRELAKTKRRRIWPAFLSLGAYVVLITELRDWLSSSNPTQYWIAVVSIVGALGLSVAIAVRLLFTSGRS
jgi:cell division septal protein FtsQ